VIAPRYAYYVWGLQYIDELIQINVADDPSGAGGGGEGASFVHQGVLHDPQYSALRLVAWDEDAADYHEPAAGALSPGDTVERYDYSPYGRRRVFGLTDALDVHGFRPLAQSQPIADPFGAVHHRANDVGFQGLHHNELLLPGAGVPLPAPSAVTPQRSPLGPGASGVTTIHQRARDYAPWLGRFLQTDPLGYPDGLNSYAAYHVMWGGVDPMGMLVETTTVVGGGVGVGLPATAVVFTGILGYKTGGALSPVFFPNIELPSERPAPSEKELLHGLIPDELPIPGPEDDPLPGEGLDPPGDCTKDVHRSMQNDVKGACTDIPSCRNMTDVKEVDKTINDIRKCMNMRKRIMDECFRGGDADHRRQYNQKRNQLKRCYEKKRELEEESCTASGQ